MATLRMIRQRLVAVKNIQKVTRAMEAVAGSRLHRAQVKATQIRPYLSAMKTLLTKVSRSSDIDQGKARKEIKRTAFVVVTADRGLCGAYNSGVLHRAEQFLKKYTPQSVDLFLFGRKGGNHFRRQKWTVDTEVFDWGGKLPFDKITSLSNQWLQDYLSMKYDEVWILYTHFVNLLLREVRLERMLPLESFKDPLKEIEGPSEYIFETNPLQIYHEILPRYLAAKLQSVLNESFASELAARAIAMKSATHNAEDKIVELTQLRNKVRQEGITKEMLEISNAGRG